MAVLGCTVAFQVGRIFLLSSQKAHPVRRQFFIELWNGLKLVWPIVSALLLTMVLSASRSLGARAGT
jgi:hypothetical protein